MMIQRTDKPSLQEEISKASGHSYFERLQKYEPNINWLKFAAKIYKKSESVRTIINYSQGICNFRDYLIQEKNLEADSTNIISSTVAEIKADNNGLVYKLLDDFVTWLQSTRGLRSNPIHGYVNGTKRLLIFLDVDIDQNKFKDKVSFTQNRAMPDEWPDNNTIRGILNASQSMKVRGYVQTLCDAGLDPIDAAELRVKDIKFEEDPVRGTKYREKTGEKLEFFLNKETTEALKQIIEHEQKGPDDYIFVQSFNPLTGQKLREYYNVAVARAGHGKLIKTKNGYYAQVDKIEGHTFGKFHPKVYKKRWFSLAIMAGVPVYVAQGMLGRKQYLDEYMRVPIDKKRDFARKILRQAFTRTKRPKMSG